MADQADGNDCNHDMTLGEASSLPPSSREGGILPITPGAIGVLEIMWRHIYPFLDVGDACRAGKTCQTLRGCSREHEQVVAYSVGPTDYMECRSMQQMMGSVCLERIEVLRFDINTDLWTWQDKASLFQQLLTILPCMKKISHLSLCLTMSGGLDQSKKRDIEHLLPRLRDVLTTCTSLTKLNLETNVNAVLVAAAPLIKHGNLTALCIVAKFDGDIGTMPREDWRGITTALVNAKRLEALYVTILYSDRLAEKIVSVIGEKGQGSPLHLREFSLFATSRTPFDFRSIFRYFTFNSECLQSVALHWGYDHCGVDGKTLEELLDRSPSIRKLDILMPAQDRDGSVARVLAKFAMTDGRWTRPGWIYYSGGSDVDYAPALRSYFEINQIPHALLTYPNKGWSVKTF